MTKLATSNEAGGGRRLFDGEGADYTVMPWLPSIRNHVGIATLI